MYAVAQAVITIPGSVQRLKKQGYCAVILFQDIWPLTYPETQAKIAEAQASSGSNDLIPLAYLSLIQDDDPF